VITDKAALDFAYADSVDLFGIFLAIGGSSYPQTLLAYGPALCGRHHGILPPSLSAADCDS